MICSSQLSRRELRAARSFTYTRTRMRPSAATRARKNHIMAARSPLLRFLRCPRLGKSRPALLEKSADPLHSLRTHGMRGDGLAFENHLRLEGAEGLRDQPLGSAIGAARPARQLLGDLERARGQLLIVHDLVHQPPPQGLRSRERAI